MTTTQAAPSSEASSDRPIEPRLERAEHGGLTFRPGDGRKPIDDCRVARCFPWSMPDRFISVRDKDGNELHLFETIDEVPEDCRQLLLEELRAEELVPKILRVHDIDDTFEITVWKVDTDRGPVEFQVKDDEDIRPLSDHTITIKDHTGMLFEIRDLRDLDERSRTLVEDRLG